MRLFNRQPRQDAHDPVEISEKKGIRYLHLGGPAVQSAMRIREPFVLELEYTRAMMAFLLFQPRPERIALIGLGGGSLAKFIHRHLPGVRLTALELNPRVVAAARSYFLLPDNDDRLEVQVADGASFVHAQAGTLDALLVDGFDANRIVEALAAPAFYAACREALRPGGVAVFNLWGSDRMFNTYYERIARAFDDHVLLLPAEKKGNVQVFAFQVPLPDVRFASLEPLAASLAKGLGLEMPAFVERMRHFNVVQAQGFRL